MFIFYTFTVDPQSDLVQKWYIKPYFYAFNLSTKVIANIFLYAIYVILSTDLFKKINNDSFFFILIL